MNVVVSQTVLLFVAKVGFSIGRGEGMFKRLFVALAVGGVILSLLSSFSYGSHGLMIRAQLNRDKYLAGDSILASGNLVYSDWPVQNALIGVRLLDQANDILLVAVRVSDSQGEFSLIFRLPPTAKSGVYVFTVMSEYASIKVSNSTAFAVVSESGDVNGDGLVDILDAVMVARAYGSIQGNTNYDARADLNLDGTINTQDISIVTNHLGQQT